MNTNSYEKREQRREKIKNIEMTTIEFNNQFTSVVSIRIKLLDSTTRESLFISSSISIDQCLQR